MGELCKLTCRCEILWSISCTLWFFSSSRSRQCPCFAWVHCYPTGHEFLAADIEKLRTVVRFGLAIVRQEELASILSRLFLEITFALSLFTACIVTRSCRSRLQVFSSGGCFWSLCPVYLISSVSDAYFALRWIRRFSFRRFWAKVVLFMVNELNNL